MGKLKKTLTSYLQQRTLFPPQITMKPSLNLGIIVVIPAYKEDFLLLSLMCLHRCELPKCDVEIIVIINDTEADSLATKEQNLKIYHTALKWAQLHYRSKMRFHILYHRDLSKKHGGVGLARKIGMDEAAYRFEKIKNKKGIIACFDADSRCEPNYFTALEKHFKINNKTLACSIYFEHPLSGYEFSPKIYEAIILYELHLRYYTYAQRFVGFPFATDTIGSSMAVRSDAYQKQGGMNKRKAGEDFYFLHKFSILGNFSELKTTKVIPSPRKSDRVPFGTGKAIKQILASQNQYLTYAPASFIDLKIFFDQVEILFLFSENELLSFEKKLPKTIQTYLQQISWQQNICEIQSQTKTKRQFTNRFFKWFNAFQIMKFVHFSREHFYKDVPIEQAASWLLEKYFQQDNCKTKTAKDLLLLFRKLDRNHFYFKHK